MHFDGETFDPGKDGVRLTGQLLAVRDAMSDHGWHTLEVLRARTGVDSEASLTARLRDLRKEKFGGYTVQRDRVPNGNGQWRYRLLPPGTREDLPADEAAPDPAPAQALPVADPPPGLFDALEISIGKPAQSAINDDWE